MKNVLFILSGLFLLAACATTQPEPTSTPLPPTESPPPSDAPVPPTQAPNPHAEAVLLAFAEAVNTLDYERAKTLCSEDCIIRGSGPGESLDSWFICAEKYEFIYAFSDFAVSGDNVEVNWYWEDTFQEKTMCQGTATMEEDKILYLEGLNCEEIE